MKLIRIFQRLLLIVVLTACSSAGGEPAASEQPTSSPTPAPVDVEIETKTIQGEATVNSISIVLLESFPVQVRVNATGFLGDGCTTLGEIETNFENAQFLVTIYTERPAEALCTQQLVGFEESIPLDVAGLPAGTYSVNVNGVIDTFTLETDNITGPLPGTDDGSTSELDLPDADVAELLRLSLERALVAQEIPDYALLAEQPQIILSTENIDADLLPGLEGVALTTMSPEEIQAKANADGDFPYLRFQGFTAVSSEEVRVSLSSSWAVAADSDLIYLSGGGFTITYTRTADGWMGVVTEMWIS